MKLKAALLLAAMPLFVAPAYAQNATSTPPAGSAPEASATPSTIASAEAEQNATAAGDIIVTAQRRSESLQRVPVSLTALSAETLTSRNLNDLTQISRAAPTLQVGIDNTFSVRGVGTLAFAGTIDSSVATAIDEVNLGRPILNTPLLNDLTRVEVLNGPQGLLFGKNASAGLINIVTARPVLGVVSSATDVEFASRATPGIRRTAPGIIARETLNIPVSATSALRLNMLYSYQEPGTTYVGTPRNGTRHDLNARSFSVKGKYFWQATDALSFYLIGDYNESHGIAGIADVTYRQVSPTSLNNGPLAADGIVAGPNNLKFGGDGDQYRDLATGGAQAKATYSFASGWELSNLFAWRYYKQDQNFDTDYLSANGLNRNESHAKYNQYSNELRLALPSSGRLSGQAGLYYFQSDLSLRRNLGGNSYTPDFVAAGSPFCVGAIVGTTPRCSVSNVSQIGSDANYVLRTKSYAAFGQLTYTIATGLTAFAGGRVTRDDIDFTTAQNQLNYFSALGGPRGTFSASYGNTDFSWKAGAQYQATPTIMAYGFYGRGYKGPGFNDSFPTATSNVIVRGETSNTGEIGVKTSFLDRRLTVNVSAFYTKFSNFQVQAFNPVTVSFLVQNAAKVKSKGVEVAVGLRPFAGFSINESASFLSSKFDSFAGAQCYPTQTTRGCSATVQTFDASGLRLPAAPAFTSSFQAMYEVPTEGPVAPFIEGNWYHRSSINYVVSQAPGATFNAVDIFGASVGAKVGKALRLALFCKNCTNKITPTAIGVDSGDANARNARGQATPMLSYTQQFGLDSVRTIGLSAQFRF